MHSNLTKNLYFGILAVVFLFVISPYSASALTISPARIEISGDPGTVVKRDITLFNDSQTSQQVYYTSYANFEAQGETGSPRFVDPTGDLGTWMQTDSSVVLPAGKSKTIELSINIPKDAYAGGHFAVVFFGTSPNNTTDSGQVTLGAKTGTLVLLSVNGDVLEAGGVAGFKTKGGKHFYNTLPVSFEYRFKNDGNDRVKPEGNIIIHNMVYWPTEKLNANAVSGNILPKSTRLFSLDWVKAPREKDYLPKEGYVANYLDMVSYQWKNFAMGPYIAHLDLVHGKSNIHSSKYTFFFVFPWQLFIVMFVIAIFVFFIFKKGLKRYNRYIIKKYNVHK